MPDLAVLKELDPGARTLQVETLSATFLPGLGMLGASLIHNGQELLGRVDDIKGYAASGRTCGIPFLHPWANRLAAPQYSAAGHDVSLDSVSALIGHDGQGLPMHGIPWARLHWQVIGEDSASLQARLDWTSDELLSVFPFPHRVEMAVKLKDDSLTLETTVFAGAEVAVPISFGFHPYFRVPESMRADWHITSPAMRQLALDARQIPTGQQEFYPSLDITLGERELDDGFALLDEGAVFSIAASKTKITVEFLEGYRFAQIFAPRSQDYLAIEPMTAPANALISGNGLRVVEAGAIFKASFRIGIQELQ